MIRRLRQTISRGVGSIAAAAAEDVGAVEDVGTTGDAALAAAIQQQQDEEDVMQQEEDSIMGANKSDDGGGKDGAVNVRAHHSATVLDGEQQHGINYDEFEGVEANPYDNNMGFDDAPDIGEDE